MSKAPHPFWLDGGYDRESVDACPHAPDHHWWTFRLDDVVRCHRRGHDHDELMIVCRGCYVPRCGHSEDPNPCLEPRHHTNPHRLANGQREPVGGYTS